MLGGNAKEKKIPCDCHYNVHYESRRCSNISAFRGGTLVSEQSFRICCEYFLLKFNKTVST
jgi:hypothetical protein